MSFGSLQLSQQRMKIARLMPRCARCPWVSRAPAHLYPHWLRRLLKSLCRSPSLCWWWCWSIINLWLHLAWALPVARPRTRPLPRFRPEPPRSRPAPAPSPAASPVRAPPPVSSAAGPEPPEPGSARQAAAPGASGCPGQNAESAVPSAWAEKPLLECLYREGPLLGRGGCGSVYAGTRLADGAPVAIKRVGRDRIWEWARLVSERGQREQPGVPKARHSIGPADGIAVPPQHNGALVPLELVRLWMVLCPGFRGVVRLLDWFELPDGFALVMERPERCRDLWHLLDAGGFLPEPVARGLFRQVLQAVRHCTSRGVLHRDIKAENILVDLATGEAKLIDFGCGTFLQDTFYTHMAGTPQYNPPEWILFGCYHGQPATIWSLGILLYDLVCGRLPFKTPEDIVRGQFFLPPRVSQECQHLIRWCLSMDPADRPCLEDLFEHSWLQNPQLAQETAEIHPSAQ
ncbi:serine/threonine-protein kinase pim-1-like [Acridotheres tristis]